MKSFLYLGITSFILLVVFTVQFSYYFDANCGSYLKLAGDAPTVEKADEFLGKALQYIERTGLTSGNSALVFSTPEEDLEIWHNQIKGAKKTTANIMERENSVSQLEKDNALMKIREVLLDHNSSGTVVTTPAWISWFPHQWLMILWWLISVMFIAIGGISKLKDS